MRSQSGCLCVSQYVMCALPFKKSRLGYVCERDMGQSSCASRIRRFSQLSPLSLLIAAVRFDRMAWNEMFATPARLKALAAWAEQRAAEIEGGKEVANSTPLRE